MSWTPPTGFQSNFLVIWSAAAGAAIAAASRTRPVLRKLMRNTSSPGRTTPARFSFQSLAISLPCGGCGRAARAGAEAAVAIAVREVDDEADREPDAEADPGRERQVPHQVEADQDAGD